MTTETIKDMITAPITDWERLRHPYAGWARVALGIASPFIIWSHDWLSITLMIVAMLACPYWFPKLKKEPTDKKMLIMIQLVDAWKSWWEKASDMDKIVLFIPGIALAIPFVAFTWGHNIFWTTYFFIMIAGYELSFIKCLLDSKKPKESASSTKNTAGKATDTKKTTARKTTAKKSAA